MGFMWAGFGVNNFAPWWFYSICCLHQTSVTSYLSTLCLCFLCVVWFLCRCEFIPKFRESDLKQNPEVLVLKLGEDQVMFHLLVFLLDDPLPECCWSVQTFSHELPLQQVVCPSLLFPQRLQTFSPTGASLLAALSLWFPPSQQNDASYTCTL